MNERWVLAFVSAAMLLSAPARAGVDGDDRRENFSLSGRDVGVVALVGVGGSVDSGSVVDPLAVVENYGDDEETFPVYLRIGTFYADTQEVTVSAGEVTTVVFAPWTADTVGTFTVRCSTALDGDTNPANDFVDTELVVEPAHGVGKQGGRPGAFRLESPAPNPFRTQARIRFGLERAGRVTLAVHSAAGTLVRIIEDARLPAGTHWAVWDGRDRTGAVAGAGVYLVRLNAGGATAACKLVRD